MKGILIGFIIGQVIINSYLLYENRILSKQLKEVTYERDDIRTRGDVE